LTIAVNRSALTTIQRRFAAGNALQSAAIPN
jgi:hypothetical protein